MVHEASRWLYQDMGRPREAIFGSLFWRHYRDISANSPYNKAEERRVHQIICEKVSEYGALMSEWHDTVYIGKDMPPQSSNHTPDSDRSTRVSHLKAVGAIKRVSKGDHRQGQGWRKGQWTKPDKSTRRAPESSSQPRRRDTLATEVKSPSKLKLDIGAILQNKCKPTSNILSKMSILSAYLSCSTKIISSSCQRQGVLKRWAKQMTPTIACTTGCSGTPTKSCYIFKDVL